MRRDATFHDGRPVTPDDVVFTFKTILDPALNARFRSLYEPIETVEAIGDDPTRFTLKAPYAPLLSYIDHFPADRGRNFAHRGAAAW